MMGWLRELDERLARVDPVVMAVVAVAAAAVVIVLVAS
jgi:hypothetical protein